MAEKRGIDNTPTFLVVDHLKELRDFLDQMREDWKSPILINSGYRCPKLNKAVSGANTSVHMIGYAADIVPKNGDFEGFINFLKDWCKDKDFDQIIIEKSGKSKWVHVGLWSNAHSQRHQIFDIIK